MRMAWVKSLSPISPSGIYFDKNSCRWCVTLYYGGRTRWIGSYTKQQDAVAARARVVAEMERS